MTAEIKSLSNGGFLILCDICGTPENPQQVSPAMGHLPNVQKRLEDHLKTHNS